ncbi:retrovirus-related pol polyprotein from transposon TNT 1-94 [Tanacetum coccineum]
MTNVAPQQYNSQSSINPSSTYVPPHFADNSQLDSGLSPTDNLIENLTSTLAILTQSYKTYLPQINNQLRTSSNPRNQATVQDGRVVVHNVQGQQNRGQGNNVWGAGHIARNCTQPKRPQNSKYFKDKMLLMQAQENGVALDEEQLLFLAGGQDNAVDEDVDEQPVQDLALNVDNVFQAHDYDAFDSDVDEAPTEQTMFMANLSSADPVYDEAGLSYDSDILSEVHDHDHYQDAICEHHEEHKMHDDVQPNYVVNSHADYTSNSNMILYDQYVKDNAVPVVQSNVSSVTNDAYMMIYNEMCEPHALSVYKTTRNTVVDNSLTAELETYKEQVELYERRARFELTEREQKIDEQLRIVITDRNIMEENLKKELHSIKLQLTSTINHNKSMVEEVTSLKKDFKQKENKYLEEFSDMKAFKEKVDDRLYKQDQSLQTVHMLCKPKPYYNELNKIRFKMDINNELVKMVSNLEVNHLNLQLKKMKASLQGKDNVINKLKTQISHLQETRSEADRTLDFRALDFQITQLTEKVTVLQEQNELFRAENAKIKQHYKELYDSIKITRAKHLEQTNALTTKNENLKAQMQTKMKSVTKDHVKPTVLAPGKYAIDVEPIPPRNRNNREVHLDYLRHLKESKETLCEIVKEAKVKQPLDRSKDETLAVVIKFLKQIQVGLSKTVRYVRTDNGTEFVNKDLTDYYECVGIFYQKTVPRTRQQNDIVERRNRTLVEVARTMLIFSKALMFLSAEVVATACYTQNRSPIHTRHDKTPYELVHDKKPDLTCFRVFGALCYPTNDS